MSHAQTEKSNEQRRSCASRPHVGRHFDIFNATSPHAAPVRWCGKEGWQPAFAAAQKTEVPGKPAIDGQVVDRLVAKVA